MMSAAPVACPCGSGMPYAACCGRFHAGEAAPTAEQLMRSRYSAYVLGLMDYIHQTWDERTRPPREELVSDAGMKWLGLEVKKHVPADGGDADRAKVEFVARFKTGGRAHRLHEESRFVRDGGRWYYVDGIFPGKNKSGQAGTSKGK